MKKDKLFLIGYMGAGKTTLGKRLAKRLGWQFVDVDRFIENRYHKPVADLFAERGEMFFREIERKALQEVAHFEYTVISTGGGAPCFFDNLDIMNQSGITVYLKVSADELMQRLTAGKQQRPLVMGKSPDELRGFIADSLVQREAWYMRAAVIFPAEIMRTRRGVDKMVDDLLQQLNEQ